MDWLKSLYPKVHQVLQGAIPGYWPELKSAFGMVFEEPLMSVAILPLAACQAVNGRAEEAVSVSAALIAAEVCVRIFDDLEDRDRPGQLWEQVGEARAWNYASAIHTLSFEILSKAAFPPDIFHRINQLYIDAFFYIAAGQDRDIAGATRTIEDYWTTIELKTATAYSAACASGAIVGTTDFKLIEACHDFGHHLGLAIQIFNDMESIWQPDGATDLKQGKITLPLLYGLQSNHPDRAELATLVETNQVAIKSDRVKAILDRIDTKAFLIWATLKEREQALEAISICPNDEGRETLKSFVTGMFGDLDQLLEENSEKVNMSVNPQKTLSYPPQAYHSTLSNLERQVERGSLFAHTVISQNSARLGEMESHLYGLIDLLLSRNFISADDLNLAAENIQKKRSQQGYLPGPGLALRIDKPTELSVIKVNCAERMHICQAVCCKLNFPLNQEEIETGVVKWDLGRPYFIRHEANGYCTHNQRTSGHCKVYANRPLVCQNYSCANDERIWKDFEKMELNVEWINENLADSGNLRLMSVYMQEVETAPSTVPPTLGQ